MKYKVEDELLYEIATLHYLEAQLEEQKALKNQILRSMQPKDLKGVDYSIEHVKGGIIKSVEQEINELIQANEKIKAMEQLQIAMQNALEKKSNCIKELLTKREKEVYDRTFINGETCEDVAFSMNISVRTIHNDRAMIVSKIRKLKEKIADIGINCV